MAGVFWSFCAYVMFPLACAALTLLLSGLGPMERLGCRLCCADVQLGIFKCNLMLFFVLIASLGFGISWHSVNKLEQLRHEQSKKLSHSGVILFIFRVRGLSFY